jgi:DNA-directed RNA polymerase subunit K/omega
MEQLDKRSLLKHARNEYFAAMLAAKVARRLHTIDPDDRDDPKAKVTSLALKLITNGKVEFTVHEPEEEPTEAEEGGGK